MNPKILVKRRGEYVFMGEEHILYLEAAGAYSNIHFMDGSTIKTSSNLKSTLSKLQDTEAFIRVHRSYVVNIRFANRLYRDNQFWFVVLNTGVELPSSSTYIKELKSRIRQFSGK